MIELLLQIDGPRCNDDAGIVFKTPKQGWDQVGERLSGAGACFNKRMLVGFECLLDAAQHFYLWCTILKVWLVLRENPLLCEERFRIIKA